MSSDGPALGQLVVSKMGRDKGKLFIVVRLVGGNYVYIADGSTHKMSDPKLKNKKHLILLDQIVGHCIEADEGLQSPISSLLRR